MPKLINAFDMIWVLYPSILSYSENQDGSCNNAFIKISVQTPFIFPSILNQIGAKEGSRNYEFWKKILPGHQQEKKLQGREMRLGASII